MIEFLFLDLDDTILDFHKAERIAIARTFREFGVEPTEEVLHRYHLINKACWERLERKEWSREQVMTGRFQILFEQMQVPGDPALCSLRYGENLSIGHYFLPGAQEALEILAPKYRLFLASNGTASIQAGRLKSAGIGKYFEKIFISQELGANKPDPVFFERAFAQIPGFQRERALMVGDSLTSDILGGIQAGIQTCLVDPWGLTADPSIQPDYRIPGIQELATLLESISERTGG